MRVKTKCLIHSTENNDPGHGFNLDFLFQFNNSNHRVSHAIGWVITHGDGKTKIRLRKERERRKSRCRLSKLLQGSSEMFPMAESGGQILPEAFP